MRIEIRLRGPLANVAGGLIQSFEMETEKTVYEILYQLINENERIRSIWNTPETVDRDALILVNDVDIGVLSGLETRLRNGDVLSLIPLVHGG